MIVRGQVARRALSAALKRATYGCTGGGTGAAGKLFGAMLFNPPNSGVNVVVDLLFLQCTAASNFSIRLVPNPVTEFPVGGALTTQPRDMRAAASLARMRTSTDVATDSGGVIGFSVATPNVGVNPSKEIADVCVLSPGSALLVEDLTAAGTANIGCWWHEE